MMSSAVGIHELPNPFESNVSNETHPVSANATESCCRRHIRGPRAPSFFAIFTSLTSLLLVYLAILELGWTEYRGKTYVQERSGTYKVVDLVLSIGLSRWRRQINQYDITTSGALDDSEDSDRIMATWDVNSPGCRVRMIEVGAQTTWILAVSALLISLSTITNVISMCNFWPSIMLIVAIALGGVGSCLWLAGVISYAVRRCVRPMDVYEDLVLSLGWTFIVACVAQVLTVLSVALFVVAMVRWWRHKERADGSGVLNDSSSGQHIQLGVIRTEQEGTFEVGEYDDEGMWDEN